MANNGHNQMMEESEGEEKWERSKRRASSFTREEEGVWGQINDGNNGRDNGQWVYEPEIEEEGMEEWTKEEE